MRYESLRRRGWLKSNIRAHSNFARSPLEEATETLRDQYEERVERLHDALDTVDVVDDGDEEPVQQIWAMTGRDAIENRTDQLIEKATNEIVLVIGHASLLTEDLVETLNEVDDEHDLIIGTLTEPLQDQVQAAVPDATTFVSGLEWLHGEHTTEDDTAIGRLLLIDRSTILVSSIMPDTKENKLSSAKGSEMASS